MMMRAKGPMSIKEFMTSALTHPAHGYYMRPTEVFGRRGDFITSPEVSQVFGELVGIWCVASWQRLGEPSRIRLVEAGPGRGTLMADVLRATAAFPAFADALTLDLIEVSDHLRSVQRETLAAAAAAAGRTPPPMNWHASLESVDATDGVPELVLAHEFLDALPVHQLVHTPRGWRERMVDLREFSDEAATPAADGGGSGGGSARGGDALPVADADATRNLEADERALGFVLAANPTPASLLFGPRLSERQGAPLVAGGGGDGDGDRLERAEVLGAVEVSPGAISFVQQVSERIARVRGAALLIDYGTDEVPADSLRGIHDHTPVHPLHKPGFVDLSVDVDFGALRDVARDAAGATLRCPPLATQRDFLAAMGLEPRINALLRATDDREARRQLVESAGRLVASPGMGTAYKVFALAHEDVGEDGVAGFGDAPKLK